MKGAKLGENALLADALARLYLGAPGEADQLLDGVGDGAGRGVSPSPSGRHLCSTSAAVHATALSAGAA